MAHYKETEKIRRSSGLTISEALIAADFQSKYFKQETFCERNNSKGEKLPGTTVLEVKRTYGAGIRIELTKHGEKRSTSLSTELGKSEVEMLLRFIDSIKDELRDYCGTFEPVKLIDLTTKKAV